MINGFLPLKEGERRENRGERREGRGEEGERGEVKGSGDFTLRSQGDKHPVDLRFNHLKAHKSGRICTNAHNLKKNLGGAQRPLHTLTLGASGTYVHFVLHTF